MSVVVVVVSVGPSAFRWRKKRLKKGKNLTKDVFGRICCFQRNFQRFPLQLEGIRVQWLAQMKTEKFRISDLNPFFSTFYFVKQLLFLFDDWLGFIQFFNSEIYLKRNFFLFFDKYCFCDTDESYKPILATSNYTF